MMYIVWQSLYRRPVQTIATLLGTAVGVAIFMTVFLLYQGLEEGMRVGSGRVGADLMVLPANVEIDPKQALFTGAPLNVYMPKKLADEVQKIPGVRKVEGRFFTQTLNESCCSFEEEVRLIGIEPKIDGITAALVPELRGKELMPDQILVGAQVIGGNKGSRISLLQEIFQIADVLAPTGTGLDQSILMPMDVAKQLARGNKEMQPYWQKMGDPENLLSELLVEVDDPRQVKVVAEAIRNTGSLRVVQTNEVFLNVKKQMQLIFILLTGAGVMALVASIIQLIARFASVTWERKGEWGLYRALGASRRYLQGLVLLESLTLSVGGAVIGIGLGALIYGQALSLIQSYQALPFLTPSLTVILVGALVALAAFAAVGVLAAGVAASGVGRIEPSLAMAKSDID
ncbi:ABC transporter permease [Heliophilum fasciatum]|uniref:Putative ABC transport system permease protein n=1 Tax=Heliophilum fasciatum TaxID=35700 RepID=A0A4R2RPP4_9FIRM|nr:FtsX-like permease family protein [Heliophilum fasciatum]MCW2277681.1 putative ABC transport system permease protein [Heliophilum fasciatum]TCP65028.1 putative ABC transport system permease protein [Heliophilum fasciatum]